LKKPLLSPVIAIVEISRQVKTDSNVINTIQNTETDGVAGTKVGTTAAYFELARYVRNAVGPGCDSRSWIVANELRIHGT
jgi:hypothetical protein